MKHLFSSLYCLFACFSICKGHQTSINGLVLLQINQSTPSLLNNNLVLIIKNDENHDDVHHLKLQINQNSFPFQFNLTNIEQIKTNGSHLLTLLIFGFPHRLLWEGIIFRQYLFVNHANNITFTVKDVSNLPKCLSAGYPCLETYNMTNQFISVCCSNTKCQRSKIEQMTCGGNIPAIRNVIITYILPMGILPSIGLLDKNFVEVIEKIYQSKSEPGTIVKIINASITAKSNNEDFKFILQFHLSLISSDSCDECLIETLHSIQSYLMPFNIPQQDGSYIMVSIQNPSINITDLTEKQTTVKAHTVHYSYSVISSTTTTTTIESSTMATYSTMITESSLIASESPTTIASRKIKIGYWTVTGNMTYPRYFHTASVLLNGTVLIVGGILCPWTAELYDLLTGDWRTIRNMTYLRYFHTSSVLSNGKVLIAGGAGTISTAQFSYSSENVGISLWTAELYDPLTGDWTAIRNMTEPRAAHTASVLSDGTVLIVGGAYSPWTAELYDPLTGDWTAIKNMTEPRALHTESVLSDGTVLIVGGDESPWTTELYDPLKGDWTVTENTTEPRAFHTESVLSDGTVLIVGGVASPWTAELYSL